MIEEILINQEWPYNSDRIGSRDNRIGTNRNRGRKDSRSRSRGRSTSKTKVKRGGVAIAENQEIVLRECQNGKIIKINNK